MSTTQYFDPCPPEAPPPISLTWIIPDAPAGTLTFAIDPVTTDYFCPGAGEWLGWLLNENGVDYVLQEDGVSLIAI